MSHTTYPPLIFYAEDDVLIRHIFLRSMETVIPKFQIKFFDNGKKILCGIEELQTKYNLVPNLIILDIEMPILDGLSTLPQIRKNKAFDSVPILMYSTLEDESYHKKALSLGANGFMNKSFSISGIESDLSTFDMYWTKIFSNLKDR